MTNRLRDKISSFLGIKKLKPKTPLTDMLDNGRMITLTRQLKSRNPRERKNAEKALAVNRIQARPYLQDLISRPDTDFNTNVSAIRILGMINGPGAIPGPGAGPSPPLKPRGLAADHVFVAEMEEKLRRTTDPRLRKEIKNVIEKLK